jgi:hypothetical protein
MPCSEVIDAAEVSPLKRTKPHAENVISVLKFSKLSEHATAPTRGSAKAAGYDLFRWVRVRDMVTGSDLNAVHFTGLYLLS